MKSYSLAEFEKIFKEQGYKNIGLFDTDGKTIVHFNNSKITAPQRWNAIKLRFAAPEMPSGYYHIKCKNTIAKDVKTDDYLIKHGDADKIPAIKTVETLSENPVNKKEETIYTQAAIDLRVDNERLKLENAGLLEKIEILEAEIEELENDIPET